MQKVVSTRRSSVFCSVFQWAGARLQHSYQVKKSVLFGCQLRCYVHTSFPTLHPMEEEEDLQVDPEDFAQDVAKTFTEDEAEEYEEQTQGISSERTKDSTFERNLQFALDRLQVIQYYRDLHAPRPMISRATKEKLYKLFCSNPKEWNVENLSLKFGLSKNRVKALLMFAKMERVADRHGELLPSSVEELLEAQFGVVHHGSDKILLEDTDPHFKLRAHGIEEDADTEALQTHLRKVVPQKHIIRPLPLNPPQEHRAQAVPMVLGEAVPRRALNRGMIIMEADDNRPLIGKRKVKLDNATRLIWIHEPTGLIRTPTWQERRYVIRNFTPQPPNRGPVPYEWRDPSLPVRPVERGDIWLTSTLGDTGRKKV